MIIQPLLTQNMIQDLFVLHNNIWSHLIVCKQMIPVENNITNKLLAYK